MLLDVVMLKQCCMSSILGAGKGQLGMECGMEWKNVFRLFIKLNDQCRKKFKSFSRLGIKK